MKMFSSRHSVLTIVWMAMLFRCKLNGLRLASICLLMIQGVGMSFGQGAWMPANADYSYPRTLIKLSEVPATQLWITRPEIRPLYQSLYQMALSFNPGTFQDNGSRRAASFAAKNSAFVYLLDRKPITGGLDTLTVSEASFFRNKAINLLGLMNTNVEAYPDFENYLWRSNELTNNLIAYDLLKGAGVPDSSLVLARAKLHEYAGNLYEQITFNFLNLGLFSLHVDNHSLRVCGAIGLAAVVLNDAVSTSVNDRATSWINAALFQIDNVMFRSSSNRQSTPGVIAGYAEGPHYFRFGMKHVLPFFHALGNFVPDTTFSVTYENTTRSIRHPWHDPNFDLLYEWILRIRLPDGRFPALEDSFTDVCYPELAITEKSSLHYPIHFSRFEGVQINTMVGQLRHSTDDMVADYIAARTEASPDTFAHFLAMPESGDLIFRNRWDSAATYLHFNGRNGLVRTSAKGHNQADVSSFLMMSQGQMLALDAGYVKWDRRGEVAEADNHNMILVDGAGPSTGQTNNAGDADGFIEDAYDLARLDYAEIRTNYLGADITRRPTYIREDYFLLADAVEGQQSHTYRWQLHGFGVIGGDSLHGTCSLDQSNHTAIWSKNGVNLLATVLSSGTTSTIQSATSAHELAYETIDSHTVLLVDQAGLDARFLAVMVPFVQDTPLVTSICGSNCGSARIDRPGFIDIATVTSLVPAAQSGLPADLFSEGDFAMVSHSTGMVWDQMLLSKGTSLILGSDTLIRAAPANDFAYARIDSANAEGFASGQGSVSFRQTEFTPGTVMGQGVSTWSYDPTHGRLTVVFSGPGRFTVHEAVIIGLDTKHADEGMEAWPIPARHAITVQLPFSDGGLDWVDPSGRVLKHWKVTDTKMTIDLGGVPNGVGLLKFTSSVSKVCTVVTVKLED